MTDTVPDTCILIQCEPCKCSSFSWCGASFSHLKQTHNKAFTLAAYFHFTAFNVITKWSELTILLLQIYTSKKRANWNHYCSKYIISRNWSNFLYTSTVPMRCYGYYKFYPNLYKTTNFVLFRFMYKMCRNHTRYRLSEFRLKF